MPDLHPGKGCPIGAACASEGIIYPHLVGNDIGCGMCLFQTNIRTKRQKIDKWVNKLYGLEQGWEGDSSEYLKSKNIEPTSFDKQSLGTIGGGNHFAELQQVLLFSIRYFIFEIYQ